MHVARIGMFHPTTCLFFPVFFFLLMYSVAAVESVQSQGKICVLDIDVQGVQNVKKSHLKPHYIFVSPPSMEVLEKRLRGRGTEKEEDVQRRLAGAAKEMEYGSVEGNFDLVLVNDDLQKTFEKLAKQMKLWYPHLKQLILSKPVVICGPTGINKGHLMEKLSERFPNQFAPAIQHTTKAESNGHQEGVDSLFVDAETMKKEVAEGKMLEYKEDKDGLVTGTSFSTVKGIVTSGKVCVLDTDVEGVKQIKKNIAKLPKDATIEGKLDPNFMFVAPVSVEMLRSQLRASGKTEEEIKPMMESASTDLEYGQVAGHFDRIFILADVSATFEDMVYALKEWYPHLDEMAPDDPAKSCTCSVS